MKCFYKKGFVFVFFLFRVECFYLSESSLVVAFLTSRERENGNSKLLFPSLGMHQCLEVRRKRQEKAFKDTKIAVSDAHKQPPSSVLVRKETSSMAFLLLEMCGVSTTVGV